MKSFNYGKLLSTVTRLINKFGTQCNVIHFVDVPDPDAPFDPPTRTEVSTPVMGVFVKANEQHADGNLIHIGDQLVLISGAIDREQVNLSGNIVRGTETWKIEAVVPIKPGPINMLYKVKVSQ